MNAGLKCTELCSLKCDNMSEMNPESDYDDEDDDE